MKRFVINALFFLLLIGLLAGTIFGKRGYVHLIYLEDEYRRMVARNQQLQLENDRLKVEIHNLKDNVRYLEELSRNELGFAKKGELIYRSDRKHKQQ